MHIIPVYVAPPSQNEAYKSSRTLEYEIFTRTKISAITVIRQKMEKKHCHNLPRDLFLQVVQACPSVLQDPALRGDKNNTKFIKEMTEEDTKKRTWRHGWWALLKKGDFSVTGMSLGVECQHLIDISSMVRTYTYIKFAIYGPWIRRPPDLMAKILCTDSFARQESPPYEQCSTPSCDSGESGCNNEKQTGSFRLKRNESVCFLLLQTLLYRNLPGASDHLVNATSGQEILHALDFKFLGFLHLIRSNVAFRSWYTVHFHLPFLGLKLTDNSSKLLSFLDQLGP